MLTSLAFLLIEIKYLTIALKLRAILYEVKDSHLYLKVKIALAVQVLVIITGFALICCLSPSDLAKKNDGQKSLKNAGIIFNILPSIIELIILAGSFYIIIKADTSKTVSKKRMLW
jgi:hypothetical protein